jgi:ketosteroid isomerase-like protein
MSTEDEVRTASEQFYAALNKMANGDASAMSEIWSHDTVVTAMHPVGGRHVGWDEVRDSFQQVAEIASDGRVRLDDQMIQVTGAMAYEIGSERGQASFAGQQVTLDHRVTNIYRREADSWRIVHHHTDTSSAMLDVLKRIQTKT